MNNTVHDYNKLIAMLMIKNESTIIERCLEHLIPLVDAIFILDTGSTDNTVDICNLVFSKHNKPYDIKTEPFKNFGYNRTISFIKAQEFCEELQWDSTITYMLTIDADMILCPSSEFKSYRLTHNGYNIIQNNGCMKYYNTRLMKASYAWKCIGSTHEYWSGDPTDKLPYEVIYIDDKNDGGCKSDKYERDVRLLTEDIKENPMNDRSNFYLAQSLKDIGRFKESIKMYKKRIAIGGWKEEVWYSYYQIGKCYEHLNEPYRMELWMNLAFDYYSDRAEPIYHLTRYFREKSQHHKSYHYYLKGRHIPYPKNDVLFIEQYVYQGLFDYENTILACYVNNKTKYDSLNDVVMYINKPITHFIDNVWDNLHYYVDSLINYNGDYQRYLIPLHQNYRASSCSIIPYNNKYLMNIRYVNYTIDEKGCYHMSCSDGHVRTKNGYVFLNESYQPLDNIVMLEDEYKKCNSNIEGLEDIRLFYHQDVLKCSSSCKDITDDDRIVITVGNYDITSNKITNIEVIEGCDSERSIICQKNWIYIPGTEMNFIYGWHPLQIGKVVNNCLQIHTTYSTPSIFSRFRGSSRLVDYYSKKYAVVHLVKYSQPRSYYHSVVQFNKDYLPEAFTLPFCFCNTRIEYCLGFDIKGDTACFIFSQNDTNPSKITLPFSRLRFISI